MSMSAPTTPLSPGGAPVAPFFQVITDYIPEHDGEIRLIVGEIISSVKDLGNGWSLGKNVSNGSVVGIFPSTCVRPWASFHHGIQSPSDLNGHAICDVIDESDLNNDQDDCHGVVSKMLPRRESPGGGGPKQCLTMMTLDRQSCKHDRRRSSAPRSRYDKRDELRCTEGCLNADRREPILHSAYSDDEDDEDDSLPKKFHIARRQHEESNAVQQHEQNVDEILDCRFVSSEHHTSSWCRKKPRMIVKPNLDKGPSQDRQQHGECEHMGNEPENNYITGSDYATYKCEGLNIAFPKCRTTAPPCNLHLKTMTTPQLCRLGVMPCQDGRLEVNDPNACDPYFRYQSAGESQQGENLTATQADLISVTTPVPNGGGCGVIEDYMKRYYRDYRSHDLPPAGQQQYESVYCDQQCKVYDTIRSHTDNPMLRCGPERNTEFSDASSCCQLAPETDNKFYRVVLSILVGQLIGFFLFLWMFYHLCYTFLLAVVVAATAAVLLALFLALSRVCRCTAAVLLPSVCTVRGRVAFVIIISGILLNGPVSNVYVNMTEISRSMSCSAEQSYNQTNFLLRPFDAMMRQLNVTVARLQESAHNVSRGLQPLDEGLAQVERDVDNGKQQLLGARKVGVHA